MRIQHTHRGPGPAFGSRDPGEENSAGTDNPDDVTPRGRGGSGGRGHRGERSERPERAERGRGRDRAERGEDGPRRGGPHGGWGSRGPRGRGGVDIPDASDAAGWFAGRLPEEWFTGAPEVTVDRDEILVIGDLPALTEEYTDAAERAAAQAGRISRFREQTRDDRIAVARQAEHRYGRQISWGARIGDTEELFTTLSSPVMTRLRQPERQVLDTLVASGVARSRSDALAWAVRLVGDHADDWLGQLRQAMQEVDRLRAEGPEL